MDNGKCFARHSLDEGGDIKTLNHFIISYLVLRISYFFDLQVSRLNLIVES